MNFLFFNLDKILKFSNSDFVGEHFTISDPKILKSYKIRFLKILIKFQHLYFENVKIYAEFSSQFPKILQKVFIMFNSTINVEKDRPRMPIEKIERFFLESVGLNEVWDKFLKFWIGTIKTFIYKMLTFINF